jgi:hypothetical protein
MKQGYQNLRYPNRKLIQEDTFLTQPLVHKHISMRLRNRRLPRRMEQRTKIMNFLMQIFLSTMSALGQTPTNSFFVLVLKEPL